MGISFEQEVIVKKKIATAILTIATACGFAQEATPQLSIDKLPQQIEVTLVKKEDTQPRKSFYYIRADVAPMADAGVLPGIGVGYRLNYDASALDFSASIKGRHSDDSRATVWTWPKVNYLYYFTPAQDGSLYLGGGLAYGGIATREETNDDDYWTTTRTEFHGLLGSACAGYEMHRSSRLRTFVQLDVNQPIAPSYRVGAFPGPSAEFSVGAGF